MKKFLLVSGTLVIAATHAFLQASDSTLTELKVGNFSNLNSVLSFDEMIDQLYGSLKNQSLEELSESIDSLVTMATSSEVSPYTLYKIFGIFHKVIEEKSAEYMAKDLSAPAPNRPASLVSGPLGSIHTAPPLSADAESFLDKDTALIQDVMDIGGNAGIDEHSVAYTENDKSMIETTLSVVLDTTFYRPYTEQKNGYGFRVGVEDSNGMGKNIVLQTAIPTGYCLELIDDHLPKDFTLFSEDNGKTRKKYDKKMTNAAEKEEGFKSPMLCNLTHIKVLLPEETNFFGKGAFGFTLKPTTTATKKLKEHCLEFTASADNAQYVEEEFCIKAL